jgi:hypothetical protein
VLSIIQLPDLVNPVRQQPVGLVMHGDGGYHARASAKQNTLPAASSTQYRRYFPVTFLDL